MKFWKKIANQFGRPTGLTGSLAGWIMANRGSNKVRNKWAIECLELRPEDRVLEIGFGPGLALSGIHAAVPNGKVFGIDHSTVMFEQAEKRNRKAIEMGKMELHCRAVTDLPAFDDPMDKILVINCMMFWKNPGTILTDLRGLLRPKGTISIVHQPRKPGSQLKDAMHTMEVYEDLLRMAGFTKIRIETLPLKPTMVIAVSGENG